jgi:hypothetical protein
MTVKRDLKKRVRARQAQTGESYTKALEKVRAQREGEEDGSEGSEGAPVKGAAGAERVEGARAGAAGVERGGGGRGGESPFQVIEMVDLSERAQGLSLHGRVLMFPYLAERVDADTALRRIREVLLATEGDPATQLLRQALLEGQSIPPRMLDSATRRETMVEMALIYGARLKVPSGATIDTVSEGARFLARARAGLGGVSPDGRILALPIPGPRGVETVVALLWGPWNVPGMPFTRPQTLILGTADQMLEDSDDQPPG